MKAGNKRSSKNFFGYAEAQSWIDGTIKELVEKDVAKGTPREKAEKKHEGTYYIQKRAGKPTRCIDYCPCKDFCNYYRGLPQEVKDS
jgi:hypothetical protein